MRKAIQERSHEKIYKTYTKNEAEVKSDNFSYHKVGRAITKWRSIKGNRILLPQYWKILYYGRAPKTISYFGGTNNIFVDNSLIIIYFKLVKTLSR